MCETTQGKVVLPSAVQYFPQHPWETHSSHIGDPPLTVPGSSADIQGDHPDARFLLPICLGGGGGSLRMSFLECNQSRDHSM